MADFVYPQGDTLPELVVPFAVYDPATGQIDQVETDKLSTWLGTVTKTTILMRQKGSQQQKVNRAASIKSAASCELAYAWQAGDLDTVGEFELEFECVAPDGKRTFPTEEPLSLKVRDDVGDGA